MLTNPFRKKDKSLPAVRATVAEDTTQFRAGANVFVVDAYWGGCDSVTVIGRQRASKRFAKAVMSVRKLSEFQMERSYSPTVHRLIQEQYSDGRSYGDKEAKDLLEVLPKWKESRTGK